MSKLAQDKYDEIRLIAAPLSVGESTRGDLCPLCGGGTQQERCFSVTRTSPATALFKCHRASCGVSGYVGYQGESRESSTVDRPPGPSIRVYTGDTGELTEPEYHYLYGAYHLSRGDVARGGWRKDKDTGRLVCPVRSPLGIQRGIETRQLLDATSFKGPKTDRFQEKSDVFLGWNKSALGYSPLVCIVEDAVSSLKVSRQYDCCFLLGTDLSIDKLIEIIRVAAGRRIVLALDRDATAKALEYVLRYRMHSPNLLAVPLSKDLKYEEDIRIKQILVGEPNGATDSRSTPPESPSVGEDDISAYAERV